MPDRPCPGGRVAHEQLVEVALGHGAKGIGPQSQSVLRIVGALRADPMRIGVVRQQLDRHRDDRDRLGLSAPLDSHRLLQPRASRLGTEPLLDDGANFIRLGRFIARHNRPYRTPSSRLSKDVTHVRTGLASLNGRREERRVALWLASEIREGGIFTKAQLRAAFPNIEQVDRRMRDLRPEGWEILTFQQDRSLEPDELRLKTMGGSVWERGYRSKANASVSEKERQAIFLADDYQCVICGIAGGEEYPDETTRVAKLTASRVDDGGAIRPVLATGVAQGGHRRSQLARSNALSRLFGRSNARSLLSGSQTGDAKDRGREALGVADEAVGRSWSRSSGRSRAS